MTYADVVELFGKEDMQASETLFRLSMSMPEFGWRDLLEVFVLLKQNFRQGQDVNRTLAGRTIGPASLPLMQKWLGVVSEARENRTYYLSDIAFRNVWRVMFETSEWDREILFQPDFFGRFSSFVDGVKPKRDPRRHRHFVSIPSRDVPERDALDFWEAMAEFRDALAEKIRAASGS